MRRQRTVKRAVVLEGVGIHSGENVKVKIKNAPVDTGIIFIRTDLENRPAIAANVSNLAADSGGLRCTSIEKDGVSVDTIEHLMAALGSLGIDNAEIEVDSRELPALDGSALDYALELQRAGILEQEKEKEELILKNAVRCDDGEASLTATPARDFSVSYLAKYNGSENMTQRADFSFAAAEKREDIFIKEIAPARTYCMESEVAAIIERGLAKGGSLKNALVIRDGRPIGNEFRFDNEPARHKILDLLGDLALINAELKAHIVGIKSGHALNARFLRKLQEVLYG
jgi:UDP-3-O-acyl N-acetylglucosamine deacetylase